MGQLQPAVASTRYLKGTIFGFAGTGKTVTAAKLAIGIQQTIGDGKPVAMFDTEPGSDFLIPIFDDAGVPLLVSKSRAFSDLLAFMAESKQAGANVAIVDSVTHAWEELKNSYEKKLKRRYGLEIWDWGKIKPDWRRFTDAMLDAQMHVIMCGRAGFEYEEREVEGKEGKLEVVKAGTKVKAESEFGYEPHLLVEMELVKPADGSSLIHRATVWKDRSTTLNGQTIDFHEDRLHDPENEVLSGFQPLLDWLRLRGGEEHRTLDHSRTSEDMIETPDSAAYRKRQVAITLDEIKACFIQAEHSMSTERGKRVVLPMLQRHFGSVSWTAVEALRLEDLQTGLDSLKRELGQHEDGYVEDRIFCISGSPWDTLYPEATVYQIRGGRPVVYDVEPTDAADRALEVDGRLFTWETDTRCYVPTDDPAEVRREPRVDEGDVEDEDGCDLDPPPSGPVHGDQSDLDAETSGTPTEAPATAAGAGPETESAPEQPAAPGESGIADGPPPYDGPDDNLEQLNGGRLLAILVDLLQPDATVVETFGELPEEETSEVRVWRQWAEREGFDPDQVHAIFSIDGGRIWLRILGMRRPRSGEPQVILAKVGPDLGGWEEQGERTPGLPRLVDWMREACRRGLQSTAAPAEG